MGASSAKNTLLNVVENDSSHAYTRSFALFIYEVWKSQSEVHSIKVGV